jgi:hypothetical protein
MIDHGFRRLHFGNWWTVSDRGDVDRKKISLCQVKGMVVQNKMRAIQNGDRFIKAGLRPKNKPGLTLKTANTARVICNGGAI